jgi:hypothetical protein
MATEGRALVGDANYAVANAVCDCLALKGMNGEWRLYAVAG